MKYKTENSCFFKDIDFHIIKELYAASESIKICVAWINFKKIERVLLSKINQGVKVEIICNHDFINSKLIKGSSLLNSEVITFVKNPIPRLYMHHKFCIIDDETLITGSYNWSSSAVYHYENIVIIKNDFKLIRQFKHEFADLHFMGKMSSVDFLSSPITKKTHKFLLGTYSSASGVHEIVDLDIWQVSLEPIKKAILLSSIQIPFFHLSVGINTDHHDFIDEKERQIDLYQQERQQIEAVQKTFDSLNFKIHAFGTAVIANDDMVLEYGEEPEREIYLNWIDMRFKKVLPTYFEADGDFEEIWYKLQNM